jgi:DNA-binding NarL/FixJ family response regulator
MINIIIVDDHKLFREGISALIASHEDLKVVADASNGKELFQLLDTDTELYPDIILLDLSMPEMDGFQVLQKIKKGKYRVKVIALSMHDEGQYISKCIRYGAQGYLLKNTEEAEFFSAIQKVYDGEKYFGKNTTELIINAMAEEGKEAKALSSRETEVLSLVAEGKTTKEIADLLSVSSRTIETHRVNMMKKLDVQNSAQLIKKATLLKLI